VKEGEKVLIFGASGGVGTFAIQIARRVLNASVVAGTCSERNAALVQSLGATRVLDYHKLSNEAILNEIKPDCVLDLVGGDVSNKSVSVRWLCEVLGVVDIYRHLHSFSFECRPCPNIIRGCAMC